MSGHNDSRSVALAYLEALGRKDFKAFGGLLAPNIAFTGPAGAISGAESVSAAYRRLAPILVRNELKRVFVDGNEVCLIYEFVTDTPAGAVPTVEWLAVENGKVQSIWLLTDHVRWPTALEELRRRAAQKAI